MLLKYKSVNRNFIFKSSVADPDPGSEIRDSVLFYPSGSGIRIRDEFFPDPGSRIPDPRGMFFGEIFLRILVL
jgi:hypothetical protein